MKRSCDGLSPASNLVAAGIGSSLLDWFRLWLVIKCWSRGYGFILIFHLASELTWCRSVRFYFDSGDRMCRVFLSALTALTEAGVCAQTGGLRRTKREQPTLRKVESSYWLGLRWTRSTDCPLSCGFTVSSGCSYVTPCARGYWLVSELLSCYARCCRAEDSEWTCSAFVHRKSLELTAQMCNPQTNGMLSDVIPGGSLTVTWQHQSVGHASPLSISWAFFLALCLAVCPGSGARWGGVFPQTALPYPRSWESSVMSSRSSLLWTHTD